MELSKSLCPGCFGSPWANPCPSCGFHPARVDQSLGLPLGAVLEETWIVGRMLGHPGRFGITYLGWDRARQSKVAIREYLPADFASRGSDGASVRVLSAGDEALFNEGLQHFRDEARALASLEHPNLVRVHAYIEAHGTGCMVMEYYAGDTVAAFIGQRGNRIDDQDAVNLMRPVLDGLHHAHSNGFLHLDVRPANICLARGLDTIPVLLDFGATRHFIGQHSHILSAAASEGYAAPEQYQRRDEHGPWTDVYGAAATLYRLLTGDAPPKANERVIHESLIPPQEAGVSPRLSQAIVAGLRLDYRQRPQAISDFIKSLEVALQPEPVAAATPARQRRRPLETPDQPQQRQHRWLWINTGLLLAGISGGFLFWQKAEVARLQAEQHQSNLQSLPTMTAPSGDAASVILDPQQAEQRLAQAVAQAANERQRAEQPWREQVEAERQRQIEQERQAEEARLQAERAAQQALRRLSMPPMVRIEPGCFTMGSPATEAGHGIDEQQRQVCIDRAYEIGKFEVTNAEFRKFRPQHHSGPGLNDDSQPVVEVSWEDAVAYTRWLSQFAEETFRLPTEAEWEYAARAGSSTAYPWGNGIGQNRANCDGCGSRWDARSSAPVGSFPANAWGLHDTVGNVWEWAGVAASTTPERGAGINSVNLRAMDRDSRALRGGSWNEAEHNARSANRFNLISGNRGSSIGFRVVHPLP